VARPCRTDQPDLATALGVTAANVSLPLAKLSDARLITRAEQGQAKIVSVSAKVRGAATRAPTSAPRT